MNNVYTKSASLIRESEAILILAGAGMGVDSGLPDFRGNSGFWREYPPYKERGLRFTDMANPEWFHNDPSFAWGFYGHRLNLYRKTIPHEGFNILLKWALDKRFGYFVFTSNVDGQFQKSNFVYNSIAEVHGSINHLQCLAGCGYGIYDASAIDIEVDDLSMRALGSLPLCPGCGGLARPNILMFGDWGWDQSRWLVQNSYYDKWLSLIGYHKLLIIECGAGTAVPTVRMEAERIASIKDASIIRINLREAYIKRPHISIESSILSSLVEIDKVL